MLPTTSGHPKTHESPCTSCIPRDVHQRFKNIRLAVTAPIGGAVAFGFERGLSQKKSS